MIIFLTLLSETIQEKESLQFCVFSIVYCIPSTQKEQFHQPQSGSGARG